jgi:beta-glucosidase
MPVRREALPYFDRDADEISYGLLHGYTKLESKGVAAAYPFGFGLGYASMEYARAFARVDKSSDEIEVEIEVHNTGDRASETVVQVYAGPQDCIAGEPVKRLCSFGRTRVEAGEQVRVQLRVRLQDLAVFDESEKCWRLASGAWQISVGGSSDRADLQEVAIELPAREWSLAGESI